MIGRVSIGRRLGAIVVAIPLVIASGLAWQIRPPLPPLPRSLRAPFPPGTATSVLHLLAWLAFVLFDLSLWWWALEYGSRRRPTEAERRLQQAVRWPPHPTPAADGPPDWRAFAALPTPPVMRLPEPVAAEPTTLAPPRAPRSAAPTAIEPQRVRPTGPPPAPREGQTGLRLLGPLELVGCKKKQPRRKATGELLAYLALQKRQASRDELLEVLWPGDDPRRSAERFYQAATEARRLLGTSFQRRRDNYYQLDRRRLWLDLDELDQLRERAETAAGQEQRTLLEHALALFAGEPFAGIEALWAEAEARRLRAVQIELLEQIGRLRLEAAEASGALAAAEQAALLDRSNERPAQLAMEAEAALGHRDAIVERYQRLCRELDDQFGLEPSRETKQLYRRLLSQDAAVDQVDQAEERPREHVTR